MDDGEREATLSVWRGDKSGGRYETYTVPTDEGMVVLDVIHRIQALRAPDLAVRWNCLLYTSPSPRDRQKSRMPSSA